MFGSGFHAQVIALLNQIISMLKVVELNEGKIMTGLTDLTADVAALQAEELQIVADFATLLAQNAGDPDAAVEAIAAQVAAVTAALQAGDPVPVLAPVAA